MTTPPASLPSITIFDVSVNDQEGRYRLCDRYGHFKYVTITTDVYPWRTMREVAALEAALPSLPEGDWNTGHIAKDETIGKPFFKSTSKVDLPGIRTWHPRLVDFLDMDLIEELRIKLYKAIDKTNDETVIAKYARFPYESEKLAAETQAYSWIEGTDIGPKFLGHVLEEGRCIGILLEQIVGARHAGPEDIDSCREVLSRLHRLGIRHGDVNRHNFLVVGERVVLIDFEASSRCEDVDLLGREMDSVEAALRDTSGAGGMIEGLE